MDADWCVLCVMQWCCGCSLSFSDPLYSHSLGSPGNTRDTTSCYSVCVTEPRWLTLCQLATPAVRRPISPQREGKKERESGKRGCPCRHANVTQSITSTAPAWSPTHPSLRPDSDPAPHPTHTQHAHTCSPLHLHTPAPPSPSSPIHFSPLSVPGGSWETS